MAPKTKTRYVEVNAGKGGFSGKLSGGGKDFDFSDLKLLRGLISNEKGRILYVLKNVKIGSIYGLAKELGRDFKSVHSDLKLLERFGFIDFVSKKNGKRESLQPVLSVERMNLVINV